MVDPVNITNFDRTDYELEEFAAFAVLVAGKTAKVIADRLNKILSAYTGNEPLHYLAHIPKLSEKLKLNGIGCYNQKADTIKELNLAIEFGDINLRTCEPWQMEIIKGIGFKTSRFFIVHSRPNVRTVIPDTHIRKGINYYFPGDPLPDHPPRNKKEFQRWENRFLYLCDKFEKGCAELDLEWWVKFSGNAVKENV